MTRDVDVDAMLRRAGEAWRSGVEENWQIDPRWFEDRQSPSRFLAIVKGAATLILVLAVVVAGFVLTGRPGPDGSATPSPSNGHLSVDAPSNTPSVAPSVPTSQPTQLFDIISDGERVVAMGTLLEDKSGHTTLCGQTVSFAFAPGGGGPACDPAVLVDVLGIEARSFPGQELGGTWVSEYVRVEGTWSGSLIEATAAVPSEPPSPSREVPCATPARGWPGTGPAAIEQPKLSSLEEFVANDPADYSGVWVGQIGDTEQTAVVVGTLSDPRVVFEQLAASYPYNLCVVAVPYGASQLQATAGQLQTVAHERPWEISVDKPADRVRITTIVLDQQLADLLSVYTNEIVVETVVIRSP
jgi:hypothetical protein